MRQVCSECSKSLDPIVAIDIDGTIGDYHGHFINFAEDWLARPLPREYDGAVKFWQFLGLTLETYRTIKLAYRQGGAKRTMPLFPGAGQLMNDLHWAGAEIWICTTRPYLRLDNVDPDTREWLGRNGIYYDHMIYGDDKYDQLAAIASSTGRDVVGVLDDLPEQVEAARALGLQPLMRRAEHNLAYRRETGEVSYTLEDAGEILVDRVKRWFNMVDEATLQETTDG